MKFIAHRGACIEYQENTLSALIRAAEYGAYAVECDLRYTADGKLILFHDNDLVRLANHTAKSCEITCEEMRKILAKAGLELTLYDDLTDNYKERSGILFDLAFHAADKEFFNKLSKAPFHAIVGVHEIDEVKLALKYFKSEDILAFIPDLGSAEAFSKAGAGNIRLWEHWLDDTAISALKAKFPPEKEIWIMSFNGSIHHPLFSMNSSVTQIDRLSALGADGILLNDIKMAVEHTKNKK